MHGGQKLFIYGFSGVAAFMSRLGIPAPMVSAVVVTAVEFLGGAALVLGVLTRLVAILLAINRLMAILTVHLRAGFFLPNGYEYALALAGPGEAAMDTVLAKRRP